MSSQKNLDNLTKLGQCFASVVDDLVVVDARNTATIDADEMWVQFFAFMTRIAKFETPDMVAQF